ncbi:unnamed protein product [Caenorhabditis angaria]|uniref:Uncharacterized protein n=1 Tax=Caenorhabditis angaria TaxID=860376 RepID=A0A9P1J1Z9_9PELO|nr:unnamed protein product [Caenorhabditis angaria]
MEEAQRREEELKQKKIIKMETLKKSSKNLHKVDEQCFSDTSSEVEFDEDDHKIMPIPEKWCCVETKKINVVAKNFDSTNYPASKN